MTPYYEDGLVTIYHRDSLDWIVADYVWPRDGVMLTDPPYGIAYKSGKKGRLAREIQADSDTSARDRALALWGSKPALVFGSWKMPPPAAARAALVWDNGGALGMGDLSIPWKPSWDLIFVLGSGFTGRRDGGVLRFAPVQSTAKNGRRHPNEKPVPLLSELLSKCPAGLVFDPFMGSGSTLVAAKRAGRRAIGIEVEEHYCEEAANRCSQDVLGLDVA